MATLEKDPVQSKDKRKGYSLAGSLSLFIHLGIFLLIGGTVIVESVIPKQPMTGEVVVSSPMAPDDSQNEPDQTPDELPPSTEVTETTTQAVSAEASPFDMNTITVDAPTPSFNISVSAMPGKTFGESSNALPGAESAGKPTSAKKAINLFGAKTEAAKLGVILDCSGSAHSFLVSALKEIDKNFDNAPTILVVGCGMGAAKDVKVEIYGRLKADKDRDKVGTRTILGQLALAESKKLKDLDKYLDRLKKRNDVWAVYGGDIIATHYGFEELIKQGVDTIYWFADFQDSLNPQIVEKLITDLKRKDIKVIAHNFSGKPVPALPTKMAGDTGGQTIAKVPN